MNTARHHRQLTSDVKLTIQRRANGHQRQASSNNHTINILNRSVDSATREKTSGNSLVSGGFKDLSDSELPAQQRAAAGYSSAP